jgi:hypothetical protein
MRLDSQDFQPLKENTMDKDHNTDTKELANQLLDMQSKLIALQTSYDSLKADHETAKTNNAEIKAKLEAAESATEGAKAALDSYKEDQLTEEAINSLVAERVEAWAKVGDKLAFDSKLTALDIRRQRLTIEFPKQAEKFKDASAEYMNAFESAFDSLQESTPKAKAPLFTTTEATIKTDSTMYPQPQKANAFMKDNDGTYTLFNLKQHKG